MIAPTVAVSDLDRSKAFYGDTLGLTFLWENPASVRFRCGDVSEISIFKRPGTATEHTLAHRRGDGHRSHGEGSRSPGTQFIDYDDGPLVTTNHIAQLGPARGAWFHDPDDNTRGLRQS